MCNLFIYLIGYKSTNIGSGGFKPTNSKNKSQKPILETILKKQEEKDDLDGSGDDDEDDIDNEDVDDNDNDDNSHGISSPISPEEEEENLSRSGSINLNPKISSRTEDDDEDLTTTVESTDEISSKMKYFVNFDYKSMRCDLQHFQQKNYAKHSPKQFVFGVKFIHFVFPQLIFLFKNSRK